MFGSLVRAIERRFIYLPERALKGTPGHIGLAYEEVWFRADDGTRLNGWWIPGPARPAGTGHPDPDSNRDEGRPAPAAWLFFHGNGGNISARLDQLLDIHRRIGAGIFIFDYRGYGLSEGVPSEDGTCLDAQAALRELTARLGGPLARVVYFGRSMGGAVAARLAIEHPPAALILESPPPSIPDMARLHVPWMRFSPLPLIMRTRYETTRHIRQVSAPVLVIQGDSDETVPAQFGRRVFDAANEPKQWLLVSGAGHNLADQAAPELYYGAIRGFLNRSGAL
jgi:pimeloyl-ACP methyl ester carboxylesterase